MGRPFVCVSSLYNLTSFHCQDPLFRWSSEEIGENFFLVFNLRERKFDLWFGVRAPARISFIRTSETKHLAMDEKKHFSGRGICTRFHNEREINIWAMDEKKHLPIFGPFRASRISFIHWTPNYKSNSRSLTLIWKFPAMAALEAIPVGDVNT